MELNVKVFILDKEDSFYCFKCAVLEAVEHDVTIKLEVCGGREYKQPQCCICTEFI